MLNALTFDIEDGWSIFSRDCLAKETGPTEIVVRDTEKILDLLEDHGVRATFFVVGEVAKKFPSLIKRIADAGHELGIHGFSHKQIFRLTREEFRAEVMRAKGTIEDLTSVAVVGHRAPAFSVNPETRWSLRVLAEEDFRYDSSIVPCQNPHYGWEGFGKDISLLDLGDGLSIVEVPMSILPIPGTSKGFMLGGGYFRHFPYFVSYAAIRHIQKTRPVVVYLHPYEFGQEVASLPIGGLSLIPRLKARWRLLVGIGNRHTVPAKIRKLLSAFEFGPVGCAIDSWLNSDQPRSKDDLDTPRRK